MLLFILLLSQICNIPHPVSIHLMLLFIRRSFCILLRVLMFQYISCYSLSLPVIRKELQHQRFNTSHVTLYLVRGLCSYSACRVSIHLMLLFIRFQRWFTCPGIVSIHLMLLFICRTRRTWNISRSVSIHLILLFIEETGSAEKKLQPFQYISCYSLSSMGYPLVLVALWVSIHLMLLFIDQQQDDSIPYCAFQYISCYSLSV